MEKQQLLIEIAKKRKELKELEDQLLCDAPGEQESTDEVQDQLGIAAYKLIAEKSFDLLSIHDDLGQYMFVSPNSERFFGWKPEELLGRNSYEFFHPEDFERIARNYNEQDESRPLRYRVRCKDGKFIWVETISRTHLGEGGYIQRIAVTRDVTDSQNIEAELRRSNEELEQFVYVASHDLQEPLRMVTKYMELIQRRYGPDLNTEAKDFISFAVDGASRMKSLIKDLLALSRVGRCSDTIKNVDLNEVVHGIVEELETAADERLEILLKDTLPTLFLPRVEAKQLFQNILSNAIKFHRDDVPPSVEISVEYQNGCHTFAVKDNGIGISDKDKEEVFLLFHRLHTRREYPGTGIGLAICKKIVESMGGTIWVESTPDVGTTVYFRLPQQPEVQCRPTTITSS